MESTKERDILLTLFDLGRQVASVIELDELLPQWPEPWKEYVGNDEGCDYQTCINQNEDSARNHASRPVIK